MTINLNCEHALNLVDENWLSKTCLQVTLECQKCNLKFIGICYPNTLEEDIE